VVQERKELGRRRRRSRKRGSRRVHEVDKGEVAAQCSEFNHTRQQPTISTHYTMDSDVS
jgi:hypothetical protein